MTVPTPRTRSELATIYRSWTPYQRALFREGQEDSRVAGLAGHLEAENWAADAVEAIAGHGITEQEDVTLKGPGEPLGLAERASELLGRALV